jgi:hypothetical protein
MLRKNTKITEKATFVVLICVKDFIFEKAKKNPLINTTKTEYLT